MEIFNVSPLLAFRIPATTPNKRKREKKPKAAVTTLDIAFLLQTLQHWIPASVKCLLSF